MPRSGDTYNLPANSKGAPNTVIQSSRYNAVLDDLAADANTPRPIVAGGTGATNATTARLNLGANNATNIDTGTLADGRLSALVYRRQNFNGGTPDANGLPEGPSISDSSTVTNFPYNSGANNWRVMQIGNAARGTQIAFNYNDFASIYFRQGQDGWESTWGKVWTNRNDGAGSGLDADTAVSASFANNANIANVATTANNANNLGGQSPGYYTDINSRLGYIPYNSNGGTVNGSINVNGGVSLNTSTGEKTYGWSGTGQYIYGNQNDGGTVGLYSAQNNAGIWTYANFLNVLFLHPNTRVGNSQVVTELSFPARAADIGVDQVGSQCMLSRVTAGTIGAGSTSLGSQLTYSNADGSSTAGTPSGTWRAHGRAVGGGGAASVTMWTRVA